MTIAWTTIGEALERAEADCDRPPHFRKAYHWRAQKLDTGLVAVCVTICGPIGSGLLLANCLPPSRVGILSWFALIPFAVATAVQAPALEKALGAFLGGLTFHWLGLSWVRTAFAVNGVGGSKATAFLLMCILGAISWPVACLALSRVAIRIRMFLALPIVWIACEFLRFRAFSVFGGDGFPMLQIGHSASHSLHVMQLAWVGGVWLVSAAILLLNGLASSVLLSVCRDASSVDRRALWRDCAFAAGVVCAIFVLGCYRTATTHLPRDGPVVCLMGNRDAKFEVAANEMERYRNESARLSNRGSMDEAGSAFTFPSDTNILLWPEASLTAIVETCRDNQERWRDPTIALLERIAAHCSVTIIVTGIRHDAACNTEHNTAFVVCNRRGLLGCYDKRCLVPFAEYQPNWTPYLSVAEAARVMAGTTCPTFQVQYHNSRPDRAGTIRVAPLICYDILFPSCARQWLVENDRNRQPDVYFVSSSEGCDPRGQLSAQVQMLTRFRAIETGRTLVRNTHAGWCGVVDPLGREIVRSVDPSRTGPQSVGPIPTSVHDGLYAKYGDWFPKLCLFGLVLLLFERK